MMVKLAVHLAILAICLLSCSQAALIKSRAGSFLYDAKVSIVVIFTLILTNQIICGIEYIIKKYKFLFEHSRIKGF